MMKLFKNKRYKFGAVLSVITMFTISCTKDFADVNTDQTKPGDEQIGLDGLASGGLFPSFINKIIPTADGGTTEPNNYQVTVNMTGDNWMGYFSPGNYGWDGGSSLPNFAANEGRLNGLFATMTRISNDYLAIKGVTHTIEVSPSKEIIYHKKALIDQAIYSVAQIIKIMGYHRTTDMFGPIPYTKLNPGKIEVEYDSQEVVYRSFLKELDEAVTTLTQYQNSGSSKILVDYDPIYQGEVSKWIKLGNSLMLRLAMRVRFADETLAKEYVNKASSHSGGLLTSKDDAAKLVENGKFRFFNSMFTLWNTYNEAKMGATIYSYLTGYDDPRIDKYFTKGTYTKSGKPAHAAIRLGVRDAGYLGNAKFSNPNIPEKAPTYWMKTSEVQFLLAEAALTGIITGSAEDFYKKGIYLSFEENGLSTNQALSYISNSKKPADFQDILKTENNMKAVSTIDKKWDKSASVEENLERIITQKYIAIYPDGLEAWSEWRRTGYPRIFKETVNLSNLSAKDINENGKDGGVRRLPFPDKEYRLNSKNINAAKAFLNGPDNAATNVWWDKKTKQ